MKSLALPVVAALLSVACAQSHAIPPAALGSIKRAALVGLDSHIAPKTEGIYQQRALLAWRAAGWKASHAQEALDAFLDGLGHGGRVKWMPVEEVARNKAYRSLPAAPDVPDHVWKDGLDRALPFSDAGYRELCEALGVDLIVQVSFNSTAVGTSNNSQLGVGEDDHVVRASMTVSGWDSTGQRVWFQNGTGVLGSKTFMSTMGGADFKDLGDAREAFQDAYRAAGRKLQKQLDGEGGSKAASPAGKKKRGAKKKVLREDEE